MTNHRVIFGSVLDCLAELSGLNARANNWQRSAELLQEAQAEANREHITRDFSFLITDCLAEDRLKKGDLKAALGSFDNGDSIDKAMMNMYEKTRFIQKHHLTFDMAPNYLEIIRRAEDEKNTRGALAAKHELYLYYAGDKQLASAKAIAPDCPHCKSEHSTKPIIYGLASETMGEHDDHFRSGCLIGPNNAPWRCTKCGYELPEKEH